jgi:hypothetical protein
MFINKRLSKLTPGFQTVKKSPCFVVETGGNFLYGSPRGKHPELFFEKKQFILRIHQ